MTTFLLILHGLVAVALLGAATHQAMSCWWPARAAGTATAGGVQAFAVSVEAGDLESAAALSAHLLLSPGAASLAGAELMVGDGFCGLRSHPRARGSVVFGGPEVPTWLDQVLAELTTTRPEPPGPSETRGAP